MLLLHHKYQKKRSYWNQRLLLTFVEELGLGFVLFGGTTASLTPPGFGFVLFGSTTASLTLLTDGFGLFGTIIGGFTILGIGFLFLVSSTAGGTLLDADVVLSDSPTAPWTLLGLVYWYLEDFVATGGGGGPGAMIGLGGRGGAATGVTKMSGTSLQGKKHTTRML
jgi:hypothetical protein